jgi:HD-like signal output (HDOD) protein/ActR/RegA family two-component response regulator
MVRYGDRKGEHRFHSLALNRIDSRVIMSKKILFVDDEPMVLMGLQRSLRSMRNEWEMVFVNGGPQALEAMSQQAFDIVVTDMRMPGMDGAELLEEVKKRSPQSLRMVLSGQSDRETILRSVNPTHQYVSKPCDGEELKSRLMRGFALKGLLENSELKGVVSKLDSLPSLPALYLELTKELDSPEPSMKKVGRLIEADMAMTAKILQLVNSAFFGLRCQVSKASYAVELLGLDIIRALVLSSHVFSQFQTTLLAEEDVRYMWEHSLATSSYAKRIAAEEKADQRLMDDCFTSALLHDAGKLIMAATLGQQYKLVLQAIQTTDKGVCEAEREIVGCTHAEVAAYLFGLWGLPHAIVEAVAWHHDPSHSLQSKFTAVAAVHAASIYHEQKKPSRMQDLTPIDLGFLSQIGCSEREPLWRRAIEEMDPERKTDNGKDSVR